MMYEITLVQDLCILLETGENPWGTLAIGLEFGYVNGRTDVIAVNSQNIIIAFEVKLIKWRDALNQAYRNTSFANESYIVLPEPLAKKVQKYTAEFYKRSVGLCVANSNKLEVLIFAKQSQPIQPWLSEAAIAYAQKK